MLLSWLSSRSWTKLTYLWGTSFEQAPPHRTHVDSFYVRFLQEIFITLINIQTNKLQLLFPGLIEDVFSVQVLISTITMNSLRGILKLNNVVS